MTRVLISAALICAVFGLAFAQFHGANQFGQQQIRSSSSCPEANGTYPVAGQCDAYLECKNGVAEEKLCPDGLLFNDKLGPHHFPCQYPIDVSCENRGRLQTAQATDECPHQFGYFKMGDRVNCGQFMNCVNGKAFMFDCPEGLAFSQETYRCEWPDAVNDCDAEAFVGFTCPPEARTDTVHHFNFYRNAQDCQVYYVCLEGSPRMYRCKEGKLFDTLTNTCEAAENVTTCGDTSAHRAQVKQSPIRQVAATAAPVQVKSQFQGFQQSGFNSNQGIRSSSSNTGAYQQTKQAAPTQAQFSAIRSSFNAPPAPVQAQPKFLVQVEDVPVVTAAPRFAFTQTTAPRHQARTQFASNPTFNFQTTGRGTKRFNAGGF